MDIYEFYDNFTQFSTDNEILRLRLSNNLKIKIKKVVRGNYAGGFGVEYEDYYYRCLDIASIYDIVMWVYNGERVVDNPIKLEQCFI